MYDGSGSGDLNINPETFYYSLIYVGKTVDSAKTLSNILGSTSVDSSLVTELGYDFGMAKSVGIETCDNLDKLYTRMKNTKNSLVRMDSSLNSLFANIDSQVNLVDLLSFGDLTSETDIQLYWEYLKDIYYGAEGKKESELSEVEKYALQAYGESGYATYDKYIEIQKEIEKLQAEYDAASAEYFATCDSWSYDEEVLKRYSDTYRALSDAKAQSKEYEQELKAKGLMEYSGWEQIGMAAEESWNKKKTLWNDFWSGNWDNLWDDACDCITSDFATMAVVTEKTIAGGLKVGEWIIDGTQMLETALATPLAWVGDKVLGTDMVGEMWDQTMSDVAIDRVGEAEKWFYEETGMGRWINSNSLLAYDSAGANLIKKGTIKVVEIAAAAVVTYFTGGAAAPFVAAGIGFLEGLGEGGEHQFSAVDENGNYTGRNLKGLGLASLNAVGKAAEWYGYGQMGNAAIQGFQTISGLGKEGLTTLAKTVTGEEAKAYLRQNAGQIAKGAARRMLTDADTWVDAGTGVVNFFTSGIESGEYNWGELALDVGLSFAGNYVGAFGGEYLEGVVQNLGTPKVATSNIGTNAAVGSEQGLMAAFVNESGEIIRFDMDDLDARIASAYDLGDMDEVLALQKEKSRMWEMAFSNKYGDDAVELISGANSDRLISDTDGILHYANGSVIDEVAGRQNRYLEDVYAARMRLAESDPKLAELYQRGKETGGKYAVFGTYEEHNFIHSTRVADEALATSRCLDQMIDEGLAPDLGKVDDDILEISGFGHDTGMRENGYAIRFDKKAGPNGAFDDIALVKDTSNGMDIRKGHPSTSATTILHEGIGGDDSEFIAALDFLHSKSNSGVKDITSEEELLRLVQTLDNNKAKLTEYGYEFDITKFVDVVDGEYVLKPDVSAKLKTGGIALRVGDARAAKTGFNHAGDLIDVRAWCDADVVYDAAYDAATGEIKASVSLDDLIGLEAQHTDINLVDTSGTRTAVLDKGSKEWISGERNWRSLGETVEDGRLTYHDQIVSGQNPASTVQRGVAEKFGEYGSFKGAVEQQVIIHFPELPDGGSDVQLMDFYRDFLPKAEGWGALGVDPGAIQVDYESGIIKIVFGGKK